MKSEEQFQSSLVCHAPHLSDDVTVGELIRWIDGEHIKAAKENPPNQDYMRAMQRLSAGVESALRSYRTPSQHPPKSASASKSTN